MSISCRPSRGRDTEATMVGLEPLAAGRQAGHRVPGYGLAVPGPRRQPALPDGPRAGVLAQTVALHRDPLGMLRRARARFGDVFTLRLTTVRPVVVVADPVEVEALLRADPEHAHAGEARREMLPMASPRS